MVASTSTPDEPTSTTGEIAHDDPFGAIGRTLARRYVVERWVGAGRTGAVYRARTLGTSDLVAVRLLALEGLVPEDELKSFVRRFTDARHAAAQVLRGDAHVARGIGTGLVPAAADAPAFAYTVHEWIDGRSFRQIAHEESPRTLADAMGLLRTAFAAVAYAHDHGLSHGDVTPGSLSLADDGDGVEVTKVLDFGVTRGVAELVNAIAPSADLMRFVAPPYTAPEQIEGGAFAEAPTAASDVYALSVLLLELMGVRPESIGAIASLLGRSRSVVERGLARDPRERWQHAGEMWVALEEANRTPTLVVPEVPTVSPRSIAPSSAQSPSSSRWAPEARTRPSLRPIAPASNAPSLAAPAIDDGGETFFDVLPPPHLLEAIQEALAAGPPSPTDPAPPPRPPPAHAPAPAALPALPPPPPHAAREAASPFGGAVPHDASAPGVARSPGSPQAPVAGPMLAPQPRLFPTSAIAAVVSAVIALLLAAAVAAWAVGRPRG